MRKTLKRVLAVSLASVMAVSAFSISAAAYNKDYQSETHTVFKHTEQTLAPGIEYYNNYAYSSDGKQMVYYVTTAEVSRDDVVCQVSYKDMQCENYGMSKLSEQVDAANAKFSDPDNAQFISENYTVVSATNGDGYNMTTGEPGGCLVMDGKVKKAWTKNASSSMFFAILNDGRAVISDSVDEWNAYMADPGIKEAIDSFGTSAKLVWDGVDVTANASGSYNTDRHSRTMFGVTEDGKVVQAVLDGRQEPFSCGGSMHELAQIMIEAGCVRAFNCDGGGSTTFMARLPGDESAKIVNRPSDGSPRSISNGMIIATTAKVKNEVASIKYTPEAEFITPGTAIKIGTIAYDEDNSVILKPSGLTFDVTGGTFENGVFTAPNETGDVTITAIFDGKELEKQVIHVVVPDSISFKDSGTIYKELGTSTPIDIIAGYSGGDVKLSASDFEISVTNTTAGYEGEEVGSFDGYIFNAPDKTVANVDRYKTATITAKVKGGTATVTGDLSFENTYQVLRDFEQTGKGSISYPYASSKQHEQATSEYVTRETGKVKNGDYALAVNLDFTQINETGYLAINHGITSSAGRGAKSLGIWVYIPENLPGLWIRLMGTNTTVDMIPTGELYKEKYDSGAWHYFSGDVSGIANPTVYQMQIYFSDRDGTSAGYYFKNATNVNNKCTLYFDDLGYDWTNGGFDFYEPAFGDITAYAGSGTVGTQLVRGSAVDVNASTVSIVANVEDDTEKNPYVVSGLDYSSAKAYIDGLEVNANAANNTITIEDATLSAGVHTAKFVISDKEGNEAVIERQLKITAGNNSALKLVSRTPVDTKLLIGSVHWFDLVSEDINKIDSAEVTLDLDGFNHWQYKRLVCADGFSYTYSIDDITNTITLNFKRTEGTPADNTLASIPVKVWESTLTTFEGYETYTPQNLFSRKIFWPIAVEIKPVVGAITLSDGAKDSFSFEKFLIDTEIDGNYAKLSEEGYFADGKKSWHLHTMDWIDPPHDATCNHYGTDGTGICTVCNEMVYIHDQTPTTSHHYEWDISKQKYVCVDCATETDELPTVDTSVKSSIGVFSDGIVENGWAVFKNEDGETVARYLEDGETVTGSKELNLYDGSGKYMLDLSTSKPYLYNGKFTGAINVGNYKCNVYEDGVLSKGTGIHEVTDGSKIWLVKADGTTAYTGTATGFMEYNGSTYCVYASKSTALHGSLNGCLWSGPENYSKNTTASTDKYYLHGKVMEGWKAVNGAAVDADGNKITGWRNADGTICETADLYDESSIIGKYYFDEDGKLTTSANLVLYHTDEKTFAESRSVDFTSKSAYLGNCGECKGYHTGLQNSAPGPYQDGMPAFENMIVSISYYSFMFINGEKQKCSSNVIEPKKFVDGYYYNVKGTNGYVISQYRLTSSFFTTTSASYNLGMDPWWIEGRYTGVIDTTDEKGYAIFGKLYENYSLKDGKVCDENGNPINMWVVNGFGDKVYYKDGVQQLSCDFVADGKAYTSDQYGKSVPVSGIVDGKYFIDGIESDNAVYADKYVVKDGKVCYVNDDNTIGEPVNGIIGETYFVNGVANDYQIVDGMIKDGDKLYTINDGMKGDAFNGVYNGVYYENGSGTEYTIIEDSIIVKEGKLYTEAKDGSLEPFYGILDDVYYENGEATEYQIIDGKYVFKDDILYNIGYSGKLAGRVTGTVDGVKYTSGVPQTGWVADTYYYKNGKKLTGVQLVDGVAYEFDDDGALIGRYNGMIFDEEADVYRMYDQGARKNGSDEFGKCVDGVPVDGWYANEYYFVNGKYLTGVQQIDGFYYDFGEDGKGDAYTKYTGLFEQDGKTYYSQLGVVVSGWKEINDNWHYFKPSDNSAASGKHTIDGIEFEFEENGKLVSGVWHNDGVGNMYYYGPTYYKSGNYSTLLFEEIDGKTYGFDQQGYRYEGIIVAHESNAQNRAYEFTNDGVYVGPSDATGIFKGQLSKLYYCKDGELAGVGMIEIDDDIYYVNTKGEVVTGNYYCTYTNGIMSPGTYAFDSDGKMIQDSSELKNGIVDGYYYVDGKLTRAGMIQIDGDYYYIKTNCHVATGTYYCTFTNGLMPEGTYKFDDSGKMILPESPKNGIVDGYYYVDGKKTHAGMVDVDGYYYYVKSDCSVATGTYYCTFTNGLMPEGFYNFDETGKMIIEEPDEQLNGVLDGFYYVDDKKTPAGMVEFEDNLYYVKSDCSVATGTYYCTYTNGLKPEGFYNFDETGKMIIEKPEEPGELLNGVVDGYYYVDGKKTHAGMVEFDGNLYYVKSDCSVATGTYYCTYTNGLKPEGFYKFDETGKMI